MKCHFAAQSSLVIRLCPFARYGKVNVRNLRVASKVSCHPHSYLFLYLCDRDTSSLSSVPQTSPAAIHINNIKYKL